MLGRGDRGLRAGFKGGCGLIVGKSGLGGRKVSGRTGLMGIVCTGLSSLTGWTGRACREAPCSEDWCTCDG